MNSCRVKESISMTTKLHVWNENSRIPLKAGINNFSQVEK